MYLYVTCSDNLTDSMRALLIVNSLEYTGVIKIQGMQPLKITGAPQIEDKFKAFPIVI